MKRSESDIIQLLSVNNLVPLLITIISIVIFLVKLQLGNDLIEYKIDQLSLKLDEYITARETDSARAQSQIDLRNRQISELQQDVAIIKTYIKLP